MNAPTPTCVALLAALLTACASAPPVRGAATSLPFDDAAHTHLRAEPGRIALCSDDGPPKTAVKVPASAGAPVDAVVDPGFGVGAIAYERALYHVDTQDGTPRPCEAPGFVIRRLGVLGERLAALGERELAFYVDARDHWKLVERCEVPRELERVVFAISTSETEYAAVGVMDGEPAIVRVSRDGGSGWRMPTQTPPLAIDELAAACNLSNRLIVFGRRITATRAMAEGPPKMDVELRGYVLDTSDFRTSRQMSKPDESYDELEVTDFALGSSHAVLVIDRSHVMGYVIADDEVRFTETTDQVRSGRFGVEWLGGNRFELVPEGAGAAVTLDLPAGG